MRRFWLPALAVAALVATPAVARADAPTVGKAPPSLGAFEVVQGEPFQDLKSLKGHVVQLVFFATW